MNQIVLRNPDPEEFPLVSKQLAESYRAAYRGMMRQDYLASLNDGHWVSILQQGVSRGDTCLIAEQNGEILGTVVYGPSPENAKTADWHAIYIAPDQIGQGLGQKLYAAMEDNMRNQGFTSCVLEVLTDNQRAIRFYQDRSFAITDTFTVEENGMTLHCHTMVKDFR